MALSPQEIRTATFKTVKRGGVDPDEVDAFKNAAADALQQAVQDSAAMEARARAAVSKLQALTKMAEPAAPEAPAAAPEPAARAATPDETETISRTLLLAQRAADGAIAEAESEAASIIETAKVDSRRAGEAERVRVEGEVQALLARRDFLESDVDALEAHLGAQRERITEVVGELEALTNRAANGLAPLRRPQLSASDTTGETARAHDGDGEADVATLIDEVVVAGEPDELAEISRIADDDRDDDGAGAHVLPRGEQPVTPPPPPPTEGGDSRHTLFSSD